METQIMVITSKEQARTYLDHAYQKLYGLCREIEGALKSFPTDWLEYCRDIIEDMRKRIHGEEDK